MKKVLNVFGIILAWILSLVLILMLMVTPLTLSALSMLDADTITKVVSGAMAPSAQAEPEQTNRGASLSLLSDTTGGEESADVSASFGDILAQAGLSEDMVSKILSSQAAKDLINAYTEDLTNAITGNGDELKFNAERVKQIVNENIDELVGILQDVSPEYAEMDLEEIKSKLMDLIDQNAEQIVDAMPKPEEVIDEIKNSVPQMEILLQIIAYKDTIKLALVGAVALIAVLIFVFRLPGFRGFRWLATDLFIGTAFNGLICGGLNMGGSIVGQMLGDNASVMGAVSSLMSAFATGMIIRTVVMLVCAVGLLVAYIFIKKALARKAEAKLIVDAALEEEAVTAETANEEV